MLSKISGAKNLTLANRLIHLLSINLSFLKPQIYLSAILSTRECRYFLGYLLQFEVSLNECVARSLALTITFKSLSAIYSSQDTEIEEIKIKNGRTPLRQS